MITMIMALFLGVGERSGRSAWEHGDLKIDQECLLLELGRAASVCSGLEAGMNSAKTSGKDSGEEQKERGQSLQSREAGLRLVGISG